jgi:hypothetical protein
MGGGTGRAPGVQVDELWFAQACGKTSPDVLELSAAAAHRTAGARCGRRPRGGGGWRPTQMCGGDVWGMGRRGWRLVQVWEDAWAPAGTGHGGAERRRCAVGTSHGPRGAAAAAVVTPW